MIYFASFMIWAWLPIVVAIFGTRRPREAVILAFLFAWLFLPTIGFDIPGLPDYTKMTATTVGAFLSVVLFDSGRLLAFRPRWYDGPMIVWCASPFVSAIVNSQGAYDGLSAVVQQVFNWGIPYLIGRLYLTDAEGMRRLTLGIAVAGLVYVPFCLIEIRLSPIFAQYIYGIIKWEGERMGTYRPRVFLTGGLELGMWMTCTSLAIVSLWSSGTVKRLWNMPFGLLTVVLVVTTFMIRATGAFALLVVGIGCIRLARLTKSSWPAWVLIGIGPFYFTTRLTGLWTGSEVVAITEATTDADRTQSIRFRFEQEEIMMRSALKRPIWGWARAGGFNIRPDGRLEAISDGFWIITLGYSGLVGLLSLWAMLCLPLALVSFRYRPSTWNDPEVASTVAMSVLLALFMVDNLSNAMLNPIYALIMGGVVAQPRRVGSRRSLQVEAALASARDSIEAGRPELAELEFRKVLEHDPDPAGPASLADRDEALEGLARSLLASGRHDEAVRAFEELVASRLAAAAEDHDPERIRDLGSAHEGLARALARLGRHGRAVGERLKAVDLWSGLVAAYPGDESQVRRRASSLNDLAWLLAADAPPGLQDPVRAAELAAEAARTAPEDPACWNTLGVARYRAGDFLGSVDALGRSIELGPPGGTAFDHYFLAMASCQLGDLDHAVAWFDQAVAWSSRHGSDHPGLARFRREASQVLEAAGLRGTPRLA